MVEFFSQHPYVGFFIGLGYYGAIIWVVFGPAAYQMTKRGSSGLVASVISCLLFIAAVWPVVTYAVLM